MSCSTGSMMTDSRDLALALLRPPKMLKREPLSFFSFFSFFSLPLPPAGAVLGYRA